MKFSSRMILGTLALGLHAGFTWAADPAPSPASDLPVAVQACQPPPGNVSDNFHPLDCLANECCDSGCNCHSGVIAGVGLYLIQPYFENNPAFVSGKIGAGGSTQDRMDIRLHTEAAPMVWLGYIDDDGLGVRARYWYFREDTNQGISPDPADGVTVTSAGPLGLLISAPPGGGLTVTSKLEMQVADLEGLQEVRAGNWDFLFSAGVRLARIDQSYNAFAAPSGMALFSGHYFEGVGPVLGLELHRPFGCSGFGLYGCARGSILFGSAEQTASIPVEDDIVTDSRDRAMPVCELELGLEFSQSCGHARIFGQVALVGQDWVGAGSASRSSVQLGPLDLAPTGSVVLDSDLALFGLAARIGMNY